MEKPEKHTGVESDEAAWHFGRSSIAAALALSFGLWLFQLVFNYGLSSYACYPVPLPRTSVMAGMGWVWPLIVDINLLCLTLALLSTGLSFRNWRLTNRYDVHTFDDVLEKGEAGAKYLEVWGLVVGAGFAAVIVFNTFALFLVPICIGI
jgi:hypothetical protein